MATINICHTVILSVCAVQMPLLSITLIFMCTCVYVCRGAHTHDVALGMCIHPRMFVCVRVGGWGPSVSLSLRLLCTYRPLNT